MHWIAPSAKDTANGSLERKLWDSADQFRANSGLKAQEYSGPILGIIFLRFAEVRFSAQRARLEKVAASSRRGSRTDEPAAYHADAKERTDFIGKIAALMDGVRSLASQIQTLRRTRDLLLPRLLSGQVNLEVN